jgi:hypothetical protein
LQEKWDVKREIRADVLRWLCLDKAAEPYVDPRGIKLYSGKISGELDLSGAVLRFPLILNRCRVPEDIKLIASELVFLDLLGSSVQAIRADRIKIKGNAILRRGFTSHGEVRLMGAQIDGSLFCDGGIFKSFPKNELNRSGTALNAQGMRVNGSIHLRNGFQSEGEVWLSGAQIGGSLDCSGGIFNNSAQKDMQTSGTALVGENISVRGDVLLRNGFQSDGEVWFVGAQIGGDLDCHGGIFKNSSQVNAQASGVALSIEHSNIAGSVLLGVGFRAEGRVSLLGARISGDLTCHDAILNEVLGDRMSVQRTLAWYDIKGLERIRLNLQNASAGSLVDDHESWPGEGKLALDGFTYGRIADGPKDSTSRLDWLSRQASFTPQPYRQLAKILREDGDDPGARHVLYEMEKRKHREAQHGWLSKLWNLIFRGTIGYGIYPRRALWWLLLLIVLGWGAYRRGYSAGMITPTNKDAYDTFLGKHDPPPNYPHFYASIYSAEHCFPLVNLGMKDAWSPDPNHLGFTTALRIFRWAQILLGWALATFFVAGITGIARKD